MKDHQFNALQSWFAMFVSLAFGALDNPLVAGGFAVAAFLFMAQSIYQERKGG